MQMSNGRKAFFITASILMSFILWFYVNNSTDVDVAISGIPVEFFNAESALANKGFVLNGGNDATEDLVLNMPRSMVYGFDTSRVRLVADLSSVNSTGTQTITYSIIYPPDTNTRQISVKSPSVRSVSVRIGELFRRNDIEIRCKLVGNVADGYVAGTVQILPETLEIWGQQSDLMKVSYAQVTLNIENASSTIVELLEYELYDHDNKLIENRGIHSSSDTVQVTMPVISATDIPLKINFIEEPGVRLNSFDYSLDVESVTLSGDANLIAQTKEIELGSIRLSDIGDEQTFTYGIPVPDGLTNLSGVTSAVLHIKNRDVETRDMTVTKFDYENFDASERVVEVVTSSLNVTLRGPKEVLEKVTSGELKAVADLSDVNDASGTYTVPAAIHVDGDLDIGTAQSYRLTVRISRAEPPEPEPEGDTEEPSDTHQPESPAQEKDNP